MTGMAALAICAAFTSCSKETNVYNPDVIEKNAVQEVYNNYNQAFVATFGQPASNQNWGFVDYSSKARTRKGDTNHNEWAAVDNTYKLLVPPALTEGQIKRVRAYFQYNRYLTYEDPELTEFFVQQVYKGGIENIGPNSPEVYTSANNRSVLGSNHMNKLTVGKAETHVNDFNNGDCGESTVLNNGTKQNDYVPDGTTHQDKITYMVGETTEYVGFHVTEGNVQHNDCCALAKASVIDAWAGSDEAKALGIDLGEAVVDGWDRSFVGLDYEELPASAAFKTVAWDNPEPAYVKLSELQPSTIWDSKTDTYMTKDEYSAAHNNTEYLLDEDGNMIPWLISNTNEFLGTPSNYENQTDVMPQKSGYGMVLDIQKIYAKVADNCYPVDTKQLQDWVKNIGGRDYYFSDWIVTLTPAQHFTVTPPEWNIRIIGEDLNATAQEGDTEDSDWDFNDVVIDVKFTGDNTCDIRVVAAGGTLPLIVGVTEPVDGQSYPDNEIHALLGQNVGTMVNTNAHLKGLPSATVAEKDLPILSNLTFAGVKAAHGANIPIYVEKIVGGQKKWLQLTANRGEPAAKIGVAPNFRIVNERNRIDSQDWYPLFSQWVAAVDYVWY